MVFWMPPISQTNGFSVWPTAPCYLKRLFAISEFYDRNRPAFYTAIQDVRDNNMDFTGWLDYFSTGLATQMEEAKELGTQIIKADIIARKHQLNDRQRNILMHIMQHKTIDLQTLTTTASEIPRRTLQRDLKQLVDKKVLKAIGKTHNCHYVLKDNKL